ncbi:integrating conjugative element protein [Pseudomonas luteola]|uniref:Integrating conjugative element protein n=1 Tax=Pseudomonas luteola TaxID=47886 RepID=A0A2X2C6R0_PSELU|nr:TIGR03752 family integrating conjugative element protein [Pseudomonas luteola]SPZ02571.1 integrating conjugative element protein [Pseudomonas luteola]
MKSNGLLKWILLLIIIAVGVVSVKGCNQEKIAVEDKPSASLTPDELKALGVEGDTSHDTMATLVAQYKALRTDLQTQLKQNEAQAEENKRLRAREAEIDQRIAQGVKGERDRLQQTANEVERDKAETRTLLDQLKQQLANNSLTRDMPVDLGLEEGDGKKFAGSSDGVTWIDPQDGQAVDAQGKAVSASTGQKVSGTVFPTSFGEATDRAQTKLGNAQESMLPSDNTSKKKKVKPVYTLPQNSTLMGSVAMTALVGRVPVDGTVNDPYPFKVLIGPDNLTANGIDLPDVAGAVVSGTASGDWTLSCVRGQVKSITFVFNDGTIRTLPRPEDAENMKTSSNNTRTSDANNEQIQGGLGWISDSYGIPCITGERRSNAKQYIGSQALITAAGAGVATLLNNSDDSSSSSVITSGGTTLGTQSMTGNQAVGSILSSGVKDVSEWVNKLYGQAFAAIYVKPGAQVAIHLDQELAIDYEIKGRKVKYGSGVPHVSRLD